MATSNICEILSIVEEQTLEQLDRYMYNLLKLIAFSITTSQAFFELSPLRHWFSELFSRIKMFSNYDFLGIKMPRDQLSRLPKPNEISPDERLEVMPKVRCEYHLLAGLIEITYLQDLIVFGC